MMATATETQIEEQMTGLTASPTTPSAESDRPPTSVFSLRGVSVYYGGYRAVRDINLELERNRVTALIGPSGSGKSTLLRSLNRMNDLVPGARVAGQVLYNGENIYEADIDAVEVRRRIGMVFQKPNPFPKSIYDNVAFGPRVNGMKPSSMDDLVEESLRKAALWDEVKDKVKKSAFSLSGGQQQRLCIARGIAVKPQVILLDEPTSALDPISTAKIEELLHELKRDFTIAIVTHNMQQAARVSDYTAYMYLGELIEHGVTDEIFIKPKMKQTEDYITGRFG